MSKEKVLGVFTKPEHIEKLASYLGKHGIKFIISTRKDDMYRKDFDIGISYCFPHIVDVKRDGRNWYNYHPAPLPEYPSITCIVSALNDKVLQYGVTLHRMSNKIDEGNILSKKMFTLLSIPENANELGTIAHYHLFQMFKNTIHIILKGYYEEGV